MAAGVSRIDRLIAFVLEKKSPKIFENIFLQNGVLAALGSKGRVKIVQGGDQFHERVHLGDNSNVGARSKFAEIPTDFQDNFKTAKYGQAVVSEAVPINMVEEMQLLMIRHMRRKEASLNSCGKLRGNRKTGVEG